MASHIPMMLDRAKGQKGALVGHIARGNSQWRETNISGNALAIFMGPDAYISPSWYKTKDETGEVVPTWNYIAVHASGSITFFDDTERLIRVVTDLTTKFEHNSEAPWKVSDAPKNYIKKQLKGIVGFEMQIGRIEGKWKLSQNRGDADRIGAIRGLRSRRLKNDFEIAKEMECAEPWRG
jgi:transcriptional regulator